MKKRLDRDTLKYIAVFAMLLDHIAWGFLEFSTPAAQLFHAVGRLTAPIMCFFISEGYYYTHDRKKYALRLAVFAIISQLAWCFFHGYSLTELSFNMMFTLLLALLAVHVEATVGNKTLKYAFISLLCLLSFYCDWHIYAILWCVFFSRYREDEAKKWLSFSLVSAAYVIEKFVSSMMYSSTDITKSALSSAFTLGIFLSVPLLLSYNGEKGKHKMNKWVFYVFYPLHLFVLGAIKLALG